MSKQIVRPRRRAEGLWFVAVELLAQCLLILIAAYVLEGIDPLRVEPLLVLVAGVAAYWTLRALGRDNPAFWLLAPATTFPHIAAAWVHNRIGWGEFLQFQYEYIDNRTTYEDMTLFVACLALLIALHRTIGIKRWNGQMLTQQVDQPERRRIVRREAILVIGLLLAGLLATGAMIALAEILVSDDGVLLSRTSLTIATIGGGAAVLLVLILLLWFRGLMGARVEEGGTVAGAMTESRQDAERS